ncbi:MAG: hypothetical protein EXS37_02185 [Opitutus sp.]|nr:hypothetical protein [Opitutus sp.]
MMRVRMNRGAKLLHDPLGLLPLMSTQQLTTADMGLPLAERVSLAQSLWQSIDSGLADTTKRDALPEAVRRDQEMSSGVVVGRSHEDVMWAARIRMRLIHLRRSTATSRRVLLSPSTTTSCRTTFTSSPSSTTAAIRTIGAIGFRTNSAAKEVSP